MKKKLRVAVLFGGRSAEHEVSLVSASSILQGLDREKYEIVQIGITHDGRWIVDSRALDWLKEGKIPEDSYAAVLPEPRGKRLLLVRESGDGQSAYSLSAEIDVFFPVLHGTYGEDGTIQGLFELMDVPYVGAGVLGSAVGMDKVVQKILFRSAGLTVVDFLYFTTAENPLESADGIRQIEERLPYPIFVKPANLGSSVGITKAHNRTELMRGIEEAYRFDRKIILEQGIENAREIEISVLGNETPRASLPGEIIPSREFYDYNAKYVNGQSQLKLPAKLPKRMIRRVQEEAIRAYRVAACEGMARVDFLLSGEKLYVSELNTIPGFTMISMYPKLWEISGLSFSALLDELICLAIDRQEKKKRLQTRAQTDSDWYKNPDKKEK